MKSNTMGQVINLQDYRNKKEDKKFYSPHLEGLHLEQEKIKRIKTAIEYIDILLEELKHPKKEHE